MSYQDAEKVRQPGEGWPGESPVLAQRAVSEGRKGSSQTILCARRTRTIKRCSFDARSEGQSGCSPLGQSGENLKALARANGTSRRASGRVGEKAARSGRSISPHP